MPIFCSGCFQASEGMVECSADVDSAVCAVLRVFADTVLHIPEHRRLLLFHKILTTLGPEHSLWLFLCLVLEEHVTHSQEELMPAARKDRGELPQRLEFALNLARSFPPFTVIVTCIKMVKYVQSLPAEKGKIIMIIWLSVIYGKDTSCIKTENKVAGLFHIILYEVVQKFSVQLDIGGGSQKNGSSFSRNSIKWNVNLTEFEKFCMKPF
jgi:hypothetical protein